MCYEVNVIFFGCGCHIRSTSSSILGIQPCTSTNPPAICDLRINNRPRFPSLNPHTRFIGIRCSAHLRAGPNEIGEDGKEVPTKMYTTVSAFLNTKAFNNDKNIERVKDKLAREATHVDQLRSDIVAHENRSRARERTREASERAHEERLKAREEQAKAWQAQKTAEREAVERAAAEKNGGVKAGALRPQLGSGFAALTLQKRHEEAKAQRALEETLRRGRVAQEARGVRFAPLPMRDAPPPPRDNEVPTTPFYGPGTRQFYGPGTTQFYEPGTTHIYGPGTTPPTRDRTEGPFATGMQPASSPHTGIQRAQDIVAPWSQPPPSRATLVGHLEADAAAMRGSAPTLISTSHPTSKIASSRGALARPRLGEELNEKGNGRAEGEASGEVGKHMTLDGVDLYE